jgi:hypothetical protein
LDLGLLVVVLVVALVRVRVKVVERVLGNL